MKCREKMKTMRLLKSESGSAAYAYYLIIASMISLLWYVYAGPIIDYCISDINTQAATTGGLPVSELRITFMQWIINAMEGYVILGIIIPLIILGIIAAKRIRSGLIG
jgi:hypothetical protein